MAMMTILIAAGGSGGHVSPALVLSRHLVAQGHRVIFTTDTRGQRFIPETEPGLTIALIAAGTLRKHPLHLIRDVFGLLWGLLQSFDLIRDHRPDMVVGFGGYPSVPPILAAQILGIPTVIHEGNAVIGAANKFLAPRARAIALSFPPDHRVPARLSPKITVTGLPVRLEITALYNQPYVPPTPAGPFHIFIMGGSQAAGILGPKLATMFTHLPDLDRARLHLIHQVRADNLADVQSLYATAGITATCAPYFEFNDVAKHLSNTHLFIGRSGASTVVEMAIAGRPSLFIPLIAATHKDAQQRENAHALVEAGGAAIIEESDFTEQNFLDHLLPLMHDPAILLRRSQNARAVAKPGATQALAELVLGVARG